MKRLEGKTALVTGGAQGIGFEGAKLFAEEGARVVIADINAEKGEAAAKAIGCEFVRCDVSKAADVQAVVAHCGTVNVLYNNAGIFWTGHDGKITDISEEDWDRVIAINPGNVLAWFNRAGFFVEMARWDDALADYNKAIELYPDFAKAYMNRAYVELQMGMKRASKEDYRTARNRVD